MWHTVTNWADIIGGGRDCGQSGTVCLGNLKEGRYKDRWLDDINVDIVQTRWQLLVRINLSQYKNEWLAVLNTAMNFSVSQILFDVLNC